MLIDDVEVKNYVDELLEADVFDEYVDEVLLHNLELDELELLRTDVVADFNIEVILTVILCDEMVEDENVDTVEDDDEVEEAILDYDVTDEVTEL